jgi:CrcB protein
VKYLLILGGGGVGSLMRYLTATAIVARAGTLFPLGTLVINVTGSFLIGILMTLFTQRFAGGTNWQPLLVIGFLGGYTTFSSFEWDAYVAIRGGSFWLGLGYIVASVGLGYAGVWLGAALVRK